MARLKLTNPLPFFYHTPSERLLYLAAGPCPFVFTVTVAAVVSNHPPGHSTAVASLTDDGTRRGLADTTLVTSETLESICADFGQVVTPMMLESRLSLWADFCDAVAGRLHGGEDLSTALAATRRPRPDEVTAA